MTDEECLAELTKGLGKCLNPAAESLHDIIYAYAMASCVELQSLIKVMFNLVKEKRNDMLEHGQSIRDFEEYFGSHPEIVTVFEEYDQLLRFGVDLVKLVTSDLPKD